MGIAEICKLKAQSDREYYEFKKRQFVKDALACGFNPMQANFMWAYLEKIEKAIKKTFL